MIYDTLDPDVADWLKMNKPPPGPRWHRQLTENYGARRLVSRCYEIIGMGKTRTTIRELREKVAHHYGKEPMQRRCICRGKPHPMTRPPTEAA